MQPACIWGLQAGCDRGMQDITMGSRKATGLRKVRPRRICASIMLRSVISRARKTHRCAQGAGRRKRHRVLHRVPLSNTNDWNEEHIRDAPRYRVMP